MERASFRDMPCSVAQCLEVVGEWWSMLIVRDAFLGISRFDEFQGRLGISRNILQKRLAHLVDEGVFERVEYQRRPPRFDYRLTAKGRDLWTVLTAMREWGDRWTMPDGPPIELVHTACGEHTTMRTTCATCGEELRARDVEAVIGSGGGGRGGAGPSLIPGPGPRAAPRAGR